MPKAKVNLDEDKDKEKKETPVNPLDNAEEIMKEGVEKAEEEEKKVEEEAKQAEEDKKNEVEVDLDEEKEKTKKETKEEIEKEVIEPLKKEVEDLKAKQTPEEKDEYDKFVEDYEKEHGEAPEWKQVAAFLKEQTKAELKAEQEAEATKAKEEEEKVKEETAKNEEANFKYWQGQLQEMEDTGLLPKMTKPEKGDKGFDARIRLYGHMQDTWKTDKPVTNLYEVYNKSYKTDADKDKQPPGADLPINMGGGTSETDKPDETIKYSEIHSARGDLEGTLEKIMKNGQTS